jgi:RHS repeat-associated protein
VGGLLLASISSTNCFATYDGNGNVTSLINATDKSVSARYEYSSYGELLRETGSFASQNPFRFSTKYLDDESGLMNYGYRFYCPRFGRWISRDPSAEEGGINLDAFVLDHPINSIDDNGLAEHHVATMQLARSLPDGPGTDYLKQFTITVSDPHYYDSAHRAYNQAIGEFFNNWCSKRGISASDFAKSSQLAKDFCQDIMNTPTSGKIGGYLSAGGGAAYWGARAAKSAIILGVAFGGVAAGYNAVAGSGDLVNAANDYKRDITSGANSAWADLDAIDAAIATQNMTGDYFVTMGVLGALLTN